MEDAIHLCPAHLFPRSIILLPSSHAEGEMLMFSLIQSAGKDADTQISDCHPCVLHMNSECNAANTETVSLFECADI